MTISFDRFTLSVLAGAGLCAAALASSPYAIADPLVQGGYNCIEEMSGLPCVAPAVQSAAIVPAAAPGPVAPVVPAAPVVPVVPVAPVVPAVPAAPVVPVVPAAPVVPVAPAAPIIPASGVPTGKGDISNPPGSEPGTGVPTLPGPAS